MASLKIYNSEGRRYTDQGVQSEVNERIRDYFFSGVRLAIDGSGTLEVITFLRARESSSGRSEQFYAVFQPDKTANILDDLKHTLRTTLEEKWGMEIDTANPDMEVFRELDAIDGHPPGTREQRETISHLLKNHERVTLGVGSAKDAVKSIAMAENAGSMAISTEGRTDALNRFDLVVELGSYSGLEPLGDTAQKFRQGKQQREDQQVEETVNSIASDVRDLRQNTSLSDSEIRNRLQKQVPVLSATASSHSTSTNTHASSSSQSHTSSSGVNTNTSSSQSSLSSSSGSQSGGILQRIPSEVFLGLAVLALLALLLLIASQLNLVTLPSISSAAANNSTSSFSLLIGSSAGAVERVRR